MEVHDRLPRRRPGVETDVVARWAEPLVEFALHRSTKSRIASCSVRLASNHVGTTRHGTKSAWPSATGRASKTAKAYSFEAIHASGATRRKGLPVISASWAGEASPASGRGWDWGEVGRGW